MSENETIGESLRLEDLFRATQQLMRESDASFMDAKDALSEAVYDMYQARRLLKEWKEDPENRRAEIAQRIEWEEYHKESLRERFEQEMYYANKRIAELKEKLEDVG